MKAETMKTTETPANQLARIQAGFSRNNFIAVQYFAACGIDPADIDPRRNVLTYNALKTAGRQIAKGAKGLPVTVWIPTSKRDENGKAQMLPKTCRLFHVSQTVDAAAEKGTPPAAAGNEYLIATDDTTDAARIARFEESTTKGIATHELSKLEAEDTTETPARPIATVSAEIADAFQMRDLPATMIAEPVGAAAGCLF